MMLLQTGLLGTGPRIAPAPHFVNNKFCRPNDEAIFYFFEIFQRLALRIKNNYWTNGGVLPGSSFYMPNADVVGVYETHVPVPFSREVIPLPSRKRILFPWGDSISIRNANHLPRSTVLHWRQ